MPGLHQGMCAPPTPGLTCHLCGEAITLLSDSTCWGQSNTVDKACKTLYNRQLERNAGYKKLKVWWKNLKPPERMEWYLNNKHNYSKHTFDYQCYAESNFEKKAKLTDDHYDYLPMDEWCLREMGLHKELTLKDAQNKFEKMLTVREHPKQKHGSGVWLLGVFRGISITGRTEEGFGRKHERKKQLQDVEDCNQCADLQEFDEGNC